MDMGDRGGHPAKGDIFSDLRTLHCYVSAAASRSDL